jgi:TatA/E family protein of Tat protein translocase
MPHVPSLLDILFIFALFLLIFGPGRLSGLGKGVGEGIRNFKKSMHAETPPAPPGADSAPPPPPLNSQQPKP